MPGEAICYEVRDWEKHFENSESRRYRSLTWVPVKNKHDGKGYRRVCQHPQSVQVFCAWSLIVQVASKMPTRGLLRDEDGPLTASDLADKTGYPSSIFEIAFKVLIEPRIGWLVAITAQQFPQIPADAQQNPVNRTEQNRIEEGEREARARADMAEIPSWAEFWGYCQSLHCGLPAEFYARDKFEAAEADNWQGKGNWRAYARRCKGWWEADGKPMTSTTRRIGKQTAKADHSKGF